MISHDTFVDEQRESSFSSPYCYTVCYRWLSCLTQKVPKSQDQFAEGVIVYLMEIDMSEEETFQVGV